MPIFKYTFKKYIKSYSTWIVTVVTMLLIVVLVGIIALRSFNIVSPLLYAQLSFVIIGSVASFLTAFVSVFSGFKAATMYKDEVEDGTFLVMLSKPVSRTRIIFEKWLALVMILIIYTFITSLTFLFTLAVFDKGDSLPTLRMGGVELSTLRDKSIVISAFLWLILFITALIFSSLAILISTRASVGATIGITTTIGVIIPITSVIGTFARKNEYISINDGQSNIAKNFAVALGFSTKDAEDVYGLSLYTQDEDKYDKLWGMDLNFQMNTLSTFATDQLIPEEARNIVAGYSDTYVIPGIPPQKNVSDWNGSSGKDKVNAIKNELNDRLATTWRELTTFRILLVKGVKTTKKTVQDVLTEWQKYSPHQISDEVKERIEDAPENIQFDGISQLWKKYFENNPTPDPNWTLSEKIKKLAEQLGINPTVAPKGEILFDKNFFDQLDSAATTAKLLLNDANYNDEQAAKTAGQKYEDQLSANQKRAIYYYLWWICAQNSNKYRGTLRADEDCMKIMDAVKANFGLSHYDLAKTLLNPMMAFDHQSFSLALTKHNISIDSTIGSEFDVNEWKNANPTAGENGVKPVDKDLPTPLYLISELNGTDNLYNDYVNVAAQGYHFAKVHKEKYVSKYRLLWTYIGIALGLLPIAFFIVRRQDFK